MTARLSTGLRNFLASGGSIQNALQNGRIEIYAGAQPVSADAAALGTLLTTITNASGPFTPEFPAQGAVTLTGAAGSVNTITVGGVNILGPNAVPFNSTLLQTMNDVVAAINNSDTYPGYSASTNGTIITISAEPGAGAAPNGLVVAATTTTLGATTSNMAGGSAAVNGLQFSAANGGSMTQLLSQVWSGLNITAGTAGWFRQYGSFQDGGALDANGVFKRIDGAIATAGAEMNVSSTAFTQNATTAIQSWVMSVPAQ